MGMPAWGAGVPYPGPYAAPGFTQPTAEQELAALQMQADHLQSALETVRKQLEKLQAEETEQT